MRSRDRLLPAPWLIAVVMLAIRSPLAYAESQNIPPPPANPAAGQPLNADELVFDSLVKDYQAKPGEFSFTFAFAFTNVATQPVIIESVRTSCGCTIAKVPTMPWTIPAGGRGEFSVVLDGRGKYGTVTKAVWVSSSIGTKSLSVRAQIPEGQDTGGNSSNEDRLRNMQIAQADRFTVFRGECATCHAQPAEGRYGASLFLSACGICHAAHNRASMVPDLQKLGHPTDREHWIKWITFGRHGSLMPAFAQSEGGILTDLQIDSLVDYLSRTIDKERLLQPAKPLAPRIGVQPPPLPGPPTPP